MGTTGGSKIGASVPPVDGVARGRGGTAGRPRAPAVVTTKVSRTVLPPSLPRTGPTKVSLPRTGPRQCRTASPSSSWCGAGSSHRKRSSCVIAVLNGYTHKHPHKPPPPPPRTHTDVVQLHQVRQHVDDKIAIQGVLRTRVVAQPQDPQTWQPLRTHQCSRHTPVTGVAAQYAAAPPRACKHATLARGTIAFFRM